MSLRLFSLALVATATAFPSQPLGKATSDDACNLCQPEGATGTNPPAVGSDLSSLYNEVLASVQGISFRKRSTESLQVRQTEGFCCRQTLDCVNVQSVNIPMCYDKFTTNFAFSDGSYGSLTTGDYTSSGSSANLLSGEYTSSSGEKGNIYANAPQAKPNTATMSKPPQFTGTGVGGALPASELGSVIIYTTTIPAVTLTAAAIRAGTTVTEATTIPAQTSVVTSTIGATAANTEATAANTEAAATSAQVSASSSGTPVTTTVAAASSSAAAERSVVDSRQMLGMPLLSVLMYALYAL
ncbi:hypothetical protein P153DRAFT_352544 [Dothidotthia symphoricarpi CBS 119687]|uniref:Uncharacterized protein n=1 Tax=Dothidotthia symphoricarpi CBS 119687 TaxID=1392245 RepID=A0A6A6ATM4_9PLEO|nr:uncharacterized protein P153DRAFT_352544 [Dothidotthia symphoricarpi CBS 119687]KAF2134563.1 hypothetical protein P153DRAFT_352544 [Dothidotthia symphoricarpi CBS 119687]